MAVKPIPEGYTSVTPYLTVDDARRRSSSTSARSARPSPGHARARRQGRTRRAPDRGLEDHALGQIPAVGLRHAEGVGGTTVAIWSSSRTSTRSCRTRRMPARRSPWSPRISSGATGWDRSPIRSETSGRSRHASRSSRPRRSRRAVERLWPHGLTDASGQRTAPRGAVRCPRRPGDPRRTASRLDVGVEAEEVAGIPGALELAQPLVLLRAAERRQLARLGDVAADRVDVDAAGRPRRERRRDRPRPVAVQRVLRGVGPLADDPRPPRAPCGRRTPSPRPGRGRSRRPAGRRGSRSGVERRRARAGDERIDRAVGEAGEVVAALPVAVAVRIDVVERRLQGGVGDRAVQVRDRRAEAVSGSSSAGPRSRSVQNGTTASTGSPQRSSGNGGVRRDVREREPERRPRRAPSGRSRARCAARPPRRRARRRAGRRGRAARPRASRYSNETTTPKLPEPPRRPQNRSGCSVSDAVTRRPSAVTSSTERRLSIVRP